MATVPGRRGLGHADLARAQRQSERHAQRPISESAFSPTTPPLCLPLPRRDVSAGGDAGGPRSLESECARALSPRRPLVRLARPTPAGARRAPNASSHFCRQASRSRFSVHPASASARKSDTQKWFGATLGLWGKQSESLPSPKSALPRPSRTPERHQHLPTTFYAQAICSPPATANSGTAPRHPPSSRLGALPSPTSPSGWSCRTRAASVPAGSLTSHGVAALPLRVVMKLLPARTPESPKIPLSNTEEGGRQRAAQPIKPSLQADAVAGG